MQSEIVEATQALKGNISSKSSTRSAGPLNSTTHRQPTTAKQPRDICDRPTSTTTDNHLTTHRQPISGVVVKVVAPNASKAIPRQLEMLFGIVISNLEL